MSTFMNQELPRVQMMQVSDLMLSAKNPRDITVDNLEDLKTSIEEDPDFMHSRPVLVNHINGLNVIYAGSQRFLACKQLGKTEVPCIVDNALPLPVLEYRMLLDNVHQGEWSDDLLNAEFSEELQNMVWGKEFSGTLVETGSNRKDKPVTLKLLFNDKDDLNRLYLLNEELKAKYPDDSVAGRLYNWLLELSED